MFRTCIRLILFILSVVLLLFLPLNPNLYAQPANDTCDSPTPLSIPSTTAGSTTTATMSTTPFCGTSHTAPEVWYEVVGTGNTMIASTCNDADYDTKISVFTGQCTVPGDSSG